GTAARRPPLVLKTRPDTSPDPLPEFRAGRRRNTAETLARPCRNGTARRPLPCALRGPDRARADEEQPGASGSAGSERLEARPVRRVDHAEARRLDLRPEFVGGGEVPALAGGLAGREECVDVLPRCRGQGRLAYRRGTGAAGKDDRLIERPEHPL